MKSNKITFNKDSSLSDISLDPYLPKNSEIKTSHVPENTDLISGKYEGGLKIWECSLDLINFLPEIFSHKDLKGLHALDLGCGHGFPGIYLLLKGASVTFQDFNQEVLDIVTKSYIEQLKEKNNLDLLCRCDFISGDWGEFKTDKKYDIIVSGDTLYNTENYDKIYSILKGYLSSEGVAYFATKKYYFGVGGSAMGFLIYVKEKKEFEIEKIKEIENGISNIRNILKVSWIKK